MNKNINTTAEYQSPVCNLSETKSKAILCTSPSLGDMPENLVIGEDFD